MSCPFGIIARSRERGRNKASNRRANYGLSKSSSRLTRSSGFCCSLYDIERDNRVEEEKVNREIVDRLGKKENETLDIR